MSIFNQNILNPPKNKFKKPKKFPKFNLFDDECEFSLDDENNNFEMYHNFFSSGKKPNLKNTSLETLDDSIIEDNSSENENNCNYIYDYKNNSNNNNNNNCKINIPNKKLCIINLLNNIKQ